MHSIANKKGLVEEKRFSLVMTTNTFYLIAYFPCQSGIVVNLVSSRLYKFLL